MLYFVLVIGIAMNNNNNNNNNYSNNINSCYYINILCCILY
jgi:hypothetical protein